MKLAQALRETAQAYSRSSTWRDRLNRLAPRRQGSWWIYARYGILFAGLFLGGCSGGRSADALSAAAAATAKCAPASSQSSAEATFCATALTPDSTPTSAVLIPTQAGPGVHGSFTTPSLSGADPSPLSTRYQSSTLQSPPSTPCPPDLCIYTDRLVLARPIALPGRDTIDTSYRFGTTQDGIRDPHHGVEFLNSHGTPVLAAAAGEVVVAGDDRKTFYGPYSYFYGNLVVLKHTIPGLEGPLLTVYGHLSKLLVEAGDRVQAGQPVGEVGMSGVATGSHLHFEIRLGENSYKNSLNPEIWLAPLAGPDGVPMGALAGRILDPQGNSLPAENIVLEHLPAADQAADFALYLKTYEEKTLIGRPPYEESFAAGDLPAGWYRISFVQSGMQSHQVQVLPGKLTVVTLRVK